MRGLKTKTTNITKIYVKKNTNNCTHCSHVVLHLSHAVVFKRYTIEKTHASIDTKGYSSRPSAPHGAGLKRSDNVRRFCAIPDGDNLNVPVVNGVYTNRFRGYFRFSFSDVDACDRNISLNQLNAINGNCRRARAFETRRHPVSFTRMF